jgi:hypothetical protein
MAASFYRTVIFFTCCFFTNYLFGQTSKRTSYDSLGGHKIINDASGKLLAWHQPSVPGAAYTQVSKLAAEFIKSGTAVHPGHRASFIPCNLLL